MVTSRLPVEPAPGSLEGFLAQFDPLLRSRAQRRCIRDYVAGLLAPSERNKTLTALAGADPLTGSKHREQQRFQWFLSESPWEHEPLNDRRIELLVADPQLAPHADGALVLDDSGDRKAGLATEYAAHQYIGRVGRVTTGIVAVTTCWCDERVYYPLHTVPYQPASRLPGWEKDPAFRTKPTIATELVNRAVAAGIVFRAVVADAWYGPNNQPVFAAGLDKDGIPYVLALKANTRIGRADGPALSPAQAAAAMPFTSPSRPGRWHRVLRSYRDGHTETWWAAEIAYGCYGPNHARRMIVATTDPNTLPALTTWYLATNLPRRARHGVHRPASLAEVVRLYGLRGWIEQGYKQAKNELGWADFQVRSGQAIQRHWMLVNLAFTFGWLQDRYSHQGPDSPNDADHEHLLVDTWPQRLRRIRAWLTPLRDLQRVIRSGALATVPLQITQLLANLTCGNGINLYLPP
jgi:SRSO17 transposase